MTIKKIMQGDSYAIPFILTLNGDVDISPDMVSELVLYVGNDGASSIRKALSEKSVAYDSSLKRWFFRPSQEETLGLDPGSYDVIARIKFSDEIAADVISILIGRIIIFEARGKEVI